MIHCGSSGYQQPIRAANHHDAVRIFTSVCWPEPSEIRVRGGPGGQEQGELTMDDDHLPVKKITDEEFIDAFADAGKRGEAIPGYARSMGRPKIVPRGTAVAFFSPPPEDKNAQRSSSGT